MCFVRFTELQSCWICLHEVRFSRLCSCLFCGSGLCNWIDVEFCMRLLSFTLLSRFVTGSICTVSILSHTSSFPTLKTHDWKKKLPWRFCCLKSRAQVNGGLTLGANLIFGMDEQKPSFLVLLCLITETNFNTRSSQEWSLCFWQGIYSFLLSFSRMFVYTNLLRDLFHN